MQPNHQHAEKSAPRIATTKKNDTNNNTTSGMLSNTSTAKPTSGPGGSHSNNNAPPQSGHHPSSVSNQPAVIPPTSPMASTPIAIPSSSSSSSSTVSNPTGFGVSFPSSLSLLSTSGGSIPTAAGIGGGHGGTGAHPSRAGSVLKRFKQLIWDRQEEDGMFSSGSDSTKKKQKGKDANERYMASPVSHETLFNEAIKLVHRRHPLQSRIKIVRDMCDFVTTYSIDNVGRVWATVQDLVLESQSPEARAVGYQFMQALTEGQYDSLGPLRVEFFRIIQTQKLNVEARFNVLSALTKGGHEITPFEQELGNLLLSWLSDKQAPRRLELIVYLARVVKYNPYLLDVKLRLALINRICDLCNSTLDVQLVECCLGFFDVVLRYGQIPAGSLPILSATLCRTLNIEKCCQASWALMTNILKSPCGHQGVLALCNILDDPANSHAVNLLRGAVFFLSMACWGSYRISMLHITRSAILPHMLRVLAFNHSIVAYEVALSIARLIRKYGKRMLVEWDLVLQILRGLDPHLCGHEDNEQYSFIAVTRDILGLMYDLSQKGQYLGSGEALVEVLEDMSCYLSEEATLGLLNDLGTLIYPANLNWLSNLHRLLVIFFQKETRPTVQLKALELLWDMFASFRVLYGDDIIDTVAPIFTSAYLHDDAFLARDVYKKGIDLLVMLASNTLSDKFYVITEIVEKAISKATNELDKYDAVTGLIFMFLNKFRGKRRAHTLRLYHTLLKLIREEHDTCRGKVISCLLSLRANRHYHLQLINVSKISRTYTTEQSDSGASSFGAGATPILAKGRKDKITSPYLVCWQQQPPMYVEAPSPSSSSGTKPPVVYQKKKSAVFPVSSLLEALVHILEHEKVYEIFVLTARAVFELLENWYILRGTDLSELASELAKQLRSNTFSSSLSARVLRDKTAKGRLVMLGYEILVQFIGYRGQIKPSNWDNIISCLCEGMSCNWATITPEYCLNIQKICINALCLCLCEIPEPIALRIPTVVNEMHRVIDRVQDKIKPHQKADLAGRVLDFYSNFMHIPTLMSALKEDERQRIFNTLMLLTDPVEYAPQISVPAYGVWGLCFMEAPVQQRLHYYKMSVNYLLQRIQQPTDNTLIALAILDLFAQWVFAGCAEAPLPSRPSSLLFEGSPCRTWVQGNCIVTMKMGKMNWIEITVRRAAGCMRWIMQSQNKIMSSLPEFLQQQRQSLEHDVTFTMLGSDKVPRSTTDANTQPQASDRQLNDPPSTEKDDVRLPPPLHKRNSSSALEGRLGGLALSPRSSPYVPDSDGPRVKALRKGPRNSLPLASIAETQEKPSMREKFAKAGKSGSSLETLLEPVDATGKVKPPQSPVEVRALQLAKAEHAQGSAEHMGSLSPRLRLQQSDSVIETRAEKEPEPPAVSPKLLPQINLTSADDESVQASKTTAVQQQVQTADSKQEDDSARRGRSMSTERPPVSSANRAPNLRGSGSGHSHSRSHSYSAARRRLGSSSKLEFPLSVFYAPLPSYEAEAENETSPPLFTPSPSDRESPPQLFWKRGRCVSSEHVDLDLHKLKLGGQMLLHSASSMPDDAVSLLLMNSSPPSLGVVPRITPTSSLSPTGATTTTNSSDSSEVSSLDDGGIPEEAEKILRSPRLLLEQPSLEMEMYTPPRTVSPPEGPQRERAPSLEKEVSPMLPPEYQLTEEMIANAAVPGGDASQSALDSSGETASVPAQAPANEEAKNEAKEPAETMETEDPKDSQVIDIPGPVPAANPGIPISPTLGTSPEVGALSVHDADSTVPRQGAQASSVETTLDAAPSTGPDHEEDSRQTDPLPEASFDGLSTSRATPLLVSSPALPIQPSADVQPSSLTNTHYSSSYGSDFATSDSLSTSKPESGSILTLPLSSSFSNSELPLQASAFLSSTGSKSSASASPIPVGTPPSASDFLPATTPRSPPVQRSLSDESKHIVRDSSIPTSSHTLQSPPTLLRLLPPSDRRGSAAGFASASLHSIAAGSLSHLKHKRASDAGMFMNKKPAAAGGTSYNPLRLFLRIPSARFDSHPSFAFAQMKNIPFIDDGVPRELSSTDDALPRNLSILDRAPCTQTVKIGVIYVGPDQTKEEEILANSVGSPRYFSFLKRLGDVARLKGTSLYAGGLDTREDTDGQYMLHWKNPMTQIVYHVVTMMPNLPSLYPHYQNKKRHIGNDNVHIVFSDSPREYKQNTISGEFNFVHIIIYPLDEGYRVTVKKKPEVGPFGPIDSVQIVSEEALVTLVRQMALSADLAAATLQDPQMQRYSNIEDRLRQLKRIAERFSQKPAEG